MSKKYIEIYSNIEKEIPLFSKKKYFHIFEKLISNKIILSNQIEKKKKLIFDFLIKIPRKEIKWKIIYEKLELKDHDLQIPLIISKYIKSKVKIIQYNFQIFSKKYNIPYEIILKFYLIICKKKFKKITNQEKLEIISLLKVMEKDENQKIIKYSSVTNIFIEHYNKKRSYDIKELEENNLFNKKYLIKKHILKKPNLLKSEFLKNNNKFEFFCPPNCLRKKILNTKLKKNYSSNIQLSISKNNNCVFDENFKSKSIKSRQINYKIYNYNPIINYSIKLKKLKINNNEKQNYEFPKNKLQIFNRNTKLLKAKNHHLNKSSMINRPKNFFSKNDLIYS